jgi:serine protease Do
MSIRVYLLLASDYLLKGIAVLNEMREVINEVATSTGPAVVGVGRRGHLGSGVIIDEGAVLTNAHNIGGNEVAITFWDGRTAVATVQGLDPDGDVAVLAVDTGDLTPVGWGDTEELGIGSPVVGLANPGGRGLRATIGYVSGTNRSFRGPRGRRITGSVEHTAPLLPGSSGGPIVDREGRLLGINTNRLGEGFYLAIPADAELRDRVEHLAAGRAPLRPYLGVSVVPGFVGRKMRRAVGLPDIAGVLVRGVAGDGPAAAAGIKDGDLIVRIGTVEIAEVDDLHGALDDAGAGEELIVAVVRGTEELELTVTLPG